jgi:hypothetical protein
MSTNEDIRTILEFIASYDLHDDVGWRCVGEYWPVTFWFNCNDLMYWGSSDCEDFTIDDLPEIKRALDDCEAALKHHGHYGISLFVCRKRGQRPQGACYPPKELWQLFDACGPEREVGLGNPYKPGQKKKSVPYAFSSEIEKICRAFLIENRISESETIYQCDWVIKNAYEFIDKIFNMYVDNDQLPEELRHEDTDAT